MRCYSFEANEISLIPDKLFASAAMSVICEFLMHFVGLRDRFLLSPCLKLISSKGRSSTEVLLLEHWREPLLRSIRLFVRLREWGNCQNQVGRRVPESSPHSTVQNSGLRTACGTVWTVSFPQCEDRGQ